MQYSIPETPQELLALGQQPINEELIATAIAGVVQISRAQGRTLDDLTAEVLADDQLLNRAQRRWLSDMVTCAWHSLPASSTYSEWSSP